jgi:hypothetical protein
MADRTKLSDPAAFDELSKREKDIVRDARDAGRDLESSDPTVVDEHLRGLHNTGGPIEQTISSKAIAGFGKPGGETDISGGIADLAETTDAPVEENEYNS